MEITAYLNKMRELKAFGAYVNSVNVPASIGFLRLLNYCRLYQNLHNESNATGLNPPLFSFVMYEYMSLV
jgi:hypothetical protein